MKKDTDSTSRKISADDARKSIEFITQHVLNAETGNKVVDIVEKMGQFLSALYHGFSSMDSMQVGRVKADLDDKAISDSARVLVNTMTSTVNDPSRLADLTHINQVLESAKSGKRALKMPTLEGVIEASEFIMENVAFFGDILIEINGLLQSFSTAKEYVKQDNSGTRAVWSPQEEELFSAIKRTK
jgi:hypothetical protein